MAVWSHSSIWYALPRHFSLIPRLLSKKISYAWQTYHHLHLCLPPASVSVASLFAVDVFAMVRPRALVSRQLAESLPWRQLAYHELASPISTAQCIRNRNKNRTRFVYLPCSLEESLQPAQGTGAGWYSAATLMRHQVRSRYALQGYSMPN